MESQECEEDREGESRRGEQIMERQGENNGDGEREGETGRIARGGRDRERDTD